LSGRLVFGASGKLACWTKGVGWIMVAFQNGARAERKGDETKMKQIKNKARTEVLMRIIMNIN